MFYVTSDLLFFERQLSNSLGRYELANCVPTEDKWAEHILYNLSHATIEEVFDSGHSADIEAWVGRQCPIKGLLFTKLISFKFARQPFGALLCVGVTRPELDYAQEHGSAAILCRLKAIGAFPVTSFNRAPVV